MFVFSIEYLIVEFQQEVYRFDPSRENVDLKNPQIFQIYENQISLFLFQFILRQPRRQIDGQHQHQHFR